MRVGVRGRPCGWYACRSFSVSVSASTRSDPMTCTGVWASKGLPVH